jgi:phage shock protein A
MAQGHILEEWRVRDIEQKADRAERRLYELDSLRSTLDSVERANRELSSCVDDLRCTCESLLQRIEQLENQLNTITDTIISPSTGD